MDDKGFELGNVSDSDVTVLDLTNSAGALRYIAGTTEDLIRDGHDNPAKWLHNAHADPKDRRAAFLLGRGWSCTVEDRQRIHDAGFPTMAINDYPADGPDPSYWCAGDPSCCYSNRVWDNVNVMKFAPVTQTKIPRPRENSYDPIITSIDAPNTFFFHHVNNLLSLESWLHVPYIAWGTTFYGDDMPAALGKEGAARSSMLIGMRLLWHLGYREIYLLGCDCTPHHHHATKYWLSVFELIDKIAPVLKHYGLNIYQTNPDSYLRSFDFVDFNEVIKNGVDPKPADELPKQTEREVRDAVRLAFTEVM